MKEENKQFGLALVTLVGVSVVLGAVSTAMFIKKKHDKLKNQIKVANEFGTISYYGDAKEAYLRQQEERTVKPENVVQHDYQPKPHVNSLLNLKREDILK